MNAELGPMDSREQRSGTTGLFAVSIAAVMSIALVGCAGYGAHETVLPHYGEDAGFISVERPVVEICDRRLGDMKATLSIVGSPGDAARVEMFCGTRSIGTCTATVPPGATTDDCTVDRATPVNNNGRFRCVATIVAGRPTAVGHDCIPL
ncbi:MAG: hypothetical protein KDG52_10885 [Rhodocyclaceae bacterium]|nr:hypothetical protein [Rhodocyclaceae bacterium]